MAITRIPDETIKTPQKIDEKKIEEFITGVTKKTSPKRTTKTVINIKFEPWLLKAIDDAAHSMSISRTAWVSIKLSKILKKDAPEGKFDK